MRRLVLICLCVGVLALPAAALALRSTPGDGTLVVKNGSAPRGVPVVTLVIDGAAIGHVSNLGGTDRVVITDLDNGFSNVAVTNVNGTLGSKEISDTVRSFTGEDFRFRAVGGVYNITIYGSGVDLFAVGQGNVTLQGNPDSTVNDGRYSLNGGEFRSLPAAPTPRLKISVPVGPNG